MSTKAEQPWQPMRVQDAGMVEKMQDKPPEALFSHSFQLSRLSAYCGGQHHHHVPSWISWTPTFYRGASSPWRSDLFTADLATEYTIVNIEDLIFNILQVLNLGTPLPLRQVMYSDDKSPLFLPSSSHLNFPHSVLDSHYVLP